MEPEGQPPLKGQGCRKDRDSSGGSDGTEFQEGDMNRMPLSSGIMLVCFVCARRNPLISVAVLVEHGGFGGAAAAPIARKVIERYLTLDRVPIEIGEGRRRTMNIIRFLERVTKPVSFKVQRLRACTPKCVSARRRELLEPKNVTD